MEIRYQQSIEDVIPISHDIINLVPLVIDYSSSYRYNQYTTFGTIEATVQTSGIVNYIEEPDVIFNDSIVLTNKIDTFGNPLFYQYQLKYDCAFPENIRVYDRDGKIIPFVIEYGDLGPSGISVPLSYNTELYSEPFDGYILNGYIEGTLVYELLSNYPELPFQIFGAALSSGKIYYPGNVLSDIDHGTLSMYVLLDDIISSGVDANILEIPVSGHFAHLSSSGIHSLEFDITGSGVETQVIADIDKWYRLDYYFDNVANTSTLKIQNVTDNSLLATFSFSTSLFKDLTDDDKVYICGDTAVLFDMGIFDYDITATGSGKKNIQSPLYVHRYSKSLNWTTTTEDSSSYRIRFAFASDIPAEVVYDGVNQDGTLMQNIREEINYRLMYKKYQNYTSADWYWSDPQVIFLEYLNSLISSSPPNNIIYVMGEPDNQVRVYYDDIDKMIHVTSGRFNSDNYNEYGDQELGELDYYYIPEYSDMPFASDNQTVFDPKYIKVTRERVNLISPYKIKLKQFYIYEGDYPEYVIPNSPEIYKYYDSNSILHTVDNGIELSYVSARGINVYKNGNLISNTEIVNYNMYEGFIEFRNKFNADDRIEVTYLKKMADNIIKYPVLNPFIETNTNFRIYIRPHYTNYDDYNPTDNQFEKLCYRVITNGFPTGSFISCYTNSSINQDIINNHFGPKVGDYVATKDGDIITSSSGVFTDDNVGQTFVWSNGQMDEITEFISSSGIRVIESHIYSAKDGSIYDTTQSRILPLADIALITNLDYEDIRTRGGGIKDELRDEYKYWPSYLDIGYSVNGKVLYSSIIFIKMSISVLQDMQDKYYHNDPAGALLYIKQSIEKYLAAGIFYIIIDENNELWIDPYPIGATKDENT